METGVLDGIICHLPFKYLQTTLYTNPDTLKEENSLNLKVCVCVSVCVHAVETYWFGYVFVCIRIAYIL